jgi:superoxide reductase
LLFVDESGEICYNPFQSGAIAVFHRYRYLGEKGRKMEGTFKTVLRVADPSSLTEVEQLHAPVIELPGAIVAGEMFAVTVKIATYPHVMEAGHYIQFVDLYADHTFLSRVTFTPTSPRPKVTLFLELNESTMLRAIAFCNLDGFWESKRWIRVE